MLVEHQKTSADTSNFCIAPFIHMYVHDNETACLLYVY